MCTNQDLQYSVGEDLLSPETYMKNPLSSPQIKLAMLNYPTHQRCINVASLPASLPPSPSTSNRRDQLRETRQALRFPARKSAGSANLTSWCHTTIPLCLGKTKTRNYKLWTVSSTTEQRISCKAVTSGDINNATENDRLVFSEVNVKYSLTCCGVTTCQTTELCPLVDQTNTDGLDAFYLY